MTQEAKVTTADVISAPEAHTPLTQLPLGWESPVPAVASVFGDDDDDDCGDDDDEPCVPDDGDGDDGDDDGDEDDG